MSVATLPEAHLDLRERAGSLPALVSYLHDRPPSGAELDALRARLYGLWATLSRHLSIEEATLFSALDATCARGELDAQAGELNHQAGRATEERPQPTPPQPESSLT
jgi:hypothetical protein